MIGCLMTIGGEVFAVTQSGQTRPIPEGPRRKIDREKARELREQLLDSLANWQEERDRLQEAMKDGPAKYHAARKVNFKEAERRIARLRERLAELDGLTKGQP